jgi:hypothetical protein
MTWSGARDLNPGPHGPELCDLSSRNFGNNRFSFEASTAASRDVQICSILLKDYYMKCYMARARQAASFAATPQARHPNDARCSYGASEPLDL